MAVAERASSAIEPAGLPGLWHAADAASAAGQHAANRRTGARLLLLLGAAVAGAASWTPGGRDVPALAAALAFFLALLLELRSALDNPEQRWYRGRAVAESVKTLAWRFAVGGAPFEAGRSDAEALLLDRLRDIIRSMRGLEWAPTDLPDQVTRPMRALRGRSLADRRTTYLRDRIDDQFAWYTRAAKRCATVADRWSIAMSTVTAAGFAGAILKGAGMLDVDVMGIASAGVASATAWTQLRQHRTLAAAYAVTAQELGLVKEHLGAAGTEQAWAAAVATAEEAISREHTLWLARRDPEV